jgi:hypothetical protein
LVTIYLDSRLRGNDKDGKKRFQFYWNLFLF